MAGVTLRDVRDAIRKNDVNKTKDLLKQVGFNPSGDNTTVATFDLVQVATAILYHAAENEFVAFDPTEMSTLIIDCFGGSVNVFAVADLIIHFCDSCEVRNDDAIIPEKIKALLSENVFNDEFAEELIELNTEKYCQVLKFILNDVKELDRRFTRPLLHFAYRHQVMSRLLFFPMMATALQWPKNVVEAMAVPVPASLASLAALSALLRMSDDDEE